MKYFLAIVLSLLTVFAYSQKTDTTYTLDSLWRNDTLFIIKTAHITVIMQDTNFLQSSPKYNRAPKEDEIVRQDFFPHYGLVNTQKNYFYEISPLVGIGYFFPVNYNFLYLDTNIQPLMYSKFGLDFSYRSRNYSLTTGIESGWLFENFNFTNRWIDVDSSLQMQANYTEYWNVDTIWFLDVDSLMAGDTVYIPYYDSTKQTKLDTEYVMKYDSNNYSRDWQQINFVSTLKIPLIYSYYFNFQNFSIDFSLGLITQIYIFKRYRVPNIYSYDLMNSYFAKFSFLAYISAGYKIDINKKISMAYDIFCEIPLNPELNVSGFSRKFNRFGLDVKLIYRFL